MIDVSFANKPRCAPQRAGLHVVSVASRAPLGLQGSVILLGNFDGLHAGHHALLTAARAVAVESGAKLGIMSCEPHPRQFFVPSTPPFRLSTRRTKLRDIENHDFDLAYVPCFDAAFAALSPERFASQILSAGLHASHVVCGMDFRFGAERRGDANLLRQLGSRLGFGVTIVPDFKLGGNRVSSTSIRREIEAGCIVGANSGLGGHWVTPLHACETRPYLSLDASLVLPPAGSYAVRLISPRQQSLPFGIVVEEGNRVTAGKALRLPAGEHLIEWLG